MFWMLWGIGSVLNAAVVSLPLLLVDGGVARLADPRFLLVLALLHLWIGCDHSIPEKGAKHYREMRVYHRQSSWFPHLCGVLIVTNIWIAVTDLVRHSAAIRPGLAAVGVCVALVGLWLRFRAVRSLGAFFTEELKILTFQPLVTSGPYRWIRHPSYTAILFILLGVNLTLASVWGVLYWTGVIVPMVLVRVAAEERLLVEGFGASFVAYRNRTRRLIPAVF